MTAFLGKYGSPAIFAVLIFCVITCDPRPAMSYVSYYDVVVAELRRDDWHTRLKEKGTINLKEEKIFDTLVDLINNTGLDWRIRIRGIHALTETGDPRTADVLIRTLQNSFITDECPAIKSNLATELGNFRDDTRVVDALIAGLDDPEVLVKEASIESLGKIGNPKAVPFLIERIKDGNFTVRLHAIRSIGRIGDKKVIPLLETIVDHEKDSYIRNEAASALARLK